MFKAISVFEHLKCYNQGINPIILRIFPENKYSIKLVVLQPLLQDRKKCIYPSKDIALDGIL